jgi:hypothetical protein
MDGDVGVGALQWDEGEMGKAKLMDSFQKFREMRR